MLKKKKVLLLVQVPESAPSRDAPTGLRNLLRQHMPGTQIELSAMSDLAMLLKGDQTRIYDARQDYDVADFDLVIFRIIGSALEEAIAIAAYCRKKQVQYVDDFVPRIGIHKLSCAFVRWEHDLSIPATLFGPNNEIQSLAAANTLDWPLIIKAVDGKKGRDNYLAHDADELAKILAENSDKRFVLQQFIANDGDYRIIVCNGSARLALLRRADNGSHLNNTSQGATAEQVSLDQLPKGVIELAERGSLTDHIAIAGADIIVDRVSGKAYILEINRAPQLSTGALVNEKIKHYCAALNELLDKKGAA